MTDEQQAREVLVKRLRDRVARWAATGQHARVTVPLPELEAALAFRAAQPGEGKPITSTYSLLVARLIMVQSILDEGGPDFAAVEEAISVLSTMPAPQRLAPRTVDSEAAMLDMENALAKPRPDREAVARSPWLGNLVDALHEARNAITDTAHKDEDPEQWDSVRLIDKALDQVPKVTCDHCGGNGYSGGTKVDELEWEDACEVCLGSGIMRLDQAKALPAEPVQEMREGERTLLAELHEAMAEVMTLRRQSNHQWEREKAASAIATWRKVQAYLGLPATEPRIPSEDGWREERERLRVALSEAAATFDQFGKALNEAPELFAQEIAVTKLAAGDARAALSDPQEQGEGK